MQQQRLLLRLSTYHRSCFSMYTTRSVQLQYQPSSTYVYSVSTKVVKQQQRMFLTSSSSSSSSLLTSLPHTKKNCSCVSCRKTQRFSFSTTEEAEPLLGVGKYKTSTGLVSVTSL
jgi:hypothetical protein